MALGKKERSCRLLREPREYATALARTEVKVDYFAASLPAAALRRRSAEAQARRLLDEVLALDGNHSRAADLRAELGAEGSHAR